LVHLVFFGFWRERDERVLRVKERVKGKWMISSPLLAWNICFFHGGIQKMHWERALECFGGFLINFQNKKYYSQVFLSDLLYKCSKTCGILLSFPSSPSLQIPPLHFPLNSLTKPKELIKLDL
jgi:hypothetical protein